MLLKDLDNDYLYGTNNYPVNVTSAYNLLVHYKNHMKPTNQIYNDSKGVSFANVEEGPERRNKYVPDVTKVKLCLQQIRTLCERLPNPSSAGSSRDNSPSSSSRSGRES
jgi:hypothetical protein